jgi:uncharacterized membrane protein
MTWIMSNLGTIVVGAIVVAVAYGAFRSVRKDFQSGGCSGCSGCKGGCSCSNNLQK